jgi:hypothetical protein
MSDILYKFAVLLFCFVLLMLGKLLYPFFAKHYKKFFPLLLLLVLVNCDPTCCEQRATNNHPVYVGIVKGMSFGADNGSTVPVIFTLQNNIQVYAFAFEKDCPLITGCSLFVNDKIQYSTKFIDNIRAQ